MNSYLEIQLRKQRHSKAIVNRNNARRQLLLKQQPDVEDIDEGEGENTPLPNRAYWEDNESDGYDERIRWIRGEHGRYFYDTRSGPQSMYWDETTPPEGFISDREFINVTTHFSEILNTGVNAVTRELQSAESPLSVAWQAAVQGDSNPSRGTSLIAAIASTHNILPEEAGRRLVTAAQAMRSDQVAALAEDGVYTTEYVGLEILNQQLSRHEEALRIGEEQEREEIEDEDMDGDPQAEGEWGGEAIEPEEAQPTPRRRTMPYENVGVSETVFDNLSPWGQASLESSEEANNNLTLFRTFPDVWLSDAGDAVMPSEYTDAGVDIVVPQHRRMNADGSEKSLKVSDRVFYPADLVKNANNAVDSYNYKTINEYLIKLVAEEGGTHQSHAPTVYTILSGDDYSLLKEAAREDGVPEEVVSELKERATTLTFEEWIQLRDTIYKRFLKRARNQQKINKENYGSYTPQRVETFDESGTGVIGTPTTDWIKDHGLKIVNASKSFKELGKLRIPTSARVWPPAEKGFRIKSGGDNSEFIKRLQTNTSGIPATVNKLIMTWFAYNVETLRLRDPVRASNEANWDFAQRQVEKVVGIVEGGIGRPGTIMSIDDKANIGAALTYNDSGSDNSWSVQGAGTSPKGFSSWPVDEIRVAINSAVDERVSELHRQGKVQIREDLGTVNDPEHNDLREIMVSWRKYGGTLLRNRETDRTHAALVFMEFASRFLAGEGKTVTTSGLGGYVTDYYKRFGFANGYRASRLNMLWTLTTMGGSYLPREETTTDSYIRSGGIVERGESTSFDPETGHMIDDVIRKSFGTGLNKVAYTEKHDTIKTDNPLNALQEMLDNLMNKADERYGFTDKKLAQANEQEIKDLQVYLEMDDEEFEEYLEGFMYMFAGTGSS